MSEYTLNDNLESE